VLIVPFIRVIKKLNMPLLVKIVGFDNNRFFRTQKQKSSGELVVRISLVSALSDKSLRLTGGDQVVRQSVRNVKQW
jgi:hypothetical protein